MKKVGDQTWYDEDEIKLGTDDIEEPGYSSSNDGCRDLLGSVVVIFLLSAVLLTTAAGCFCEEGSTWSCQCYNFRGEYIGNNSGEGCRCDCTALECGARVENCEVYRPQRPEIYPRPKKGGRDGRTQQDRVDG